MNLVILPNLTNEEIIAYLQTEDNLSVIEKELLKRLSSAIEYYEEDIAWLKRKLESLSDDNEDLHREIHKLSDELWELKGNN